MVTKFSDLDLSKSYTYGDYLMWNFEEKVELIKGKIFKMSPAPSMKHQGVVRNIVGNMFNSFGNNSCKLFSLHLMSDLFGKGKLT